MKFEEPKSKIGKSMLGVTVSYYANNRPMCRWYLNNEVAPLTKISELLGYSNEHQFKHAISKYGVPLIMMKGLDKLRISNHA